MILEAAELLSGVSEVRRKRWIFRRQSKSECENRHVQERTFTADPPTSAKSWCPIASYLGGVGSSRCMSGLVNADLVLQATKLTSILRHLKPRYRHLLEPPILDAAFALGRATLRLLPSPGRRAL